MSKPIKKTVIFTSYACNNKCVFCIDSDKRHLSGRTTGEIKKEIEKARKRGSEYLELIGGETTIRKDLVDIISFAKSHNFSTISITTNGRMLSYKNKAREIVEAGLTDIVLSIHSYNSDLHDRLTRVPGSFEELMKGLENLKQLNFNRIGSNTTVVKQNYKDLSKIGNFIFGLGIKNAEFIFVDPNEGEAKNKFFDLVPRISEIEPYVKECLEIGRKNNLPHWHIRYVPLCYFEDYLDQISEIEEVKKFNTEHIAEDFINSHAERGRAEIGRAKGGQCSSCKFNNLCEGIWVEYLKNYGDDELKPIL